MMIPSSQRWIHATIVLVASTLAAHAGAAEWKAGVAREAITPDQPTWMAGYGSRDKPSEGTEHDLWAKALALVDPEGNESLIISLDICGIDGALSRRVRDAIREEHGIGDARIVLACSHTHCGPVLGENLLTMYPLDQEQHRRVVQYTKAFEKKVLNAARGALAAAAPARLSWETGRADFAVNRRANKEPEVPELRARNALEGPVDHDVPVLKIASKEGDLRCVVFGYACHCTVLSFNKFCGDYAGFAQIALEKQYPGSQAMFVAGCGADQNPLPRRTVELARQYGGQLAGAVSRVLDRPTRPITGASRAAYETVDLRLDALPTREQVAADAKSANFYIASRAKMLLGKWDADGKLASSYPYPVQAWKLDDLTWIFLGGEVVVDYSLRLKRNLGSSTTWVSGYCNDVMAYIPSLRVLKEGGYEGATAMIYYGLPTSWSPDVETQIIDSVTRLIQANSKPSAVTR